MTKAEMNLNLIQHLHEVSHQIDSLLVMGELQNYSSGNLIKILLTMLE